MGKAWFVGGRQSVRFPLSSSHVKHTCSAAIVLARSAGSHSEKLLSSRGNLFRFLNGEYCHVSNCSLNTIASFPVSGPDFSKAELIPVIAQDDATGDVLMLAYMNREAYDETLATGRVCYFSRSRQKLWRKGEESGNVQELKSIYYDCDADTLLAKVNQIGGAACHEGYRSCFFRKIDPKTGEVETIGERVFDPKEVYKKS